MATKKRHFIATEVADLLGISIQQVYTMLKEGELKGHKTHSGKWLIPKGQSAFDDIDIETTDNLETEQVSPHVECETRKDTDVCIQTDNEEKPSEFLKYISDSEHYSIVFSRMTQVAKSLKITSCNLKNFTVHGIDSNGKDVSVRFAEFLLDLCNRGVKVQIACMKPFWFFAYIHDNLPELENHPNFDLRQQDYMHMKVFIFDDDSAYIGSANLTGAALGLRANGKRNHEAGILAKGNDIFHDALNHFNRVWTGNGIHRYKYHEFRKERKELQEKNNN
ncbi:MAG: phospholipase D-like domain-containing protein [Bacteroidaceae bacterium]|nr:phospholipase D-like domain-containing protein [Bacteroidaceae bacterium]